MTDPRDHDGRNTQSAEAQLAALRDELRRWTQTSTPDLPAEAPAQHSPAVDEAPLESTASHAPGTEGPRPSATEAEVMRSVELVEEFADELAEQQAASAAHVEAIEREVLVLAGAVFRRWTGKNPGEWRHHAATPAAR